MNHTSKIHKWLLLMPLLACIAGCANNEQSNGTSAKTTDSAVENASSTTPSLNGDSLPAPFATESVKNYCKVIGWPQNKTPVAPNGFTVTKFAGGLDNPRWIYQSSNGDIFVAQANTEVTGIKKKGQKFPPQAKARSWVKAPILYCYSEMPTKMGHTKNNMFLPLTSTGHWAC